MDNLIGKEALAAFKQKFEALYLGNKDAERLALDILFVSHVWDDLIDDGNSEYTNTAFRKLIYDIPINPLMRSHGAQLSILLLNCYNQWLAANEFEAKKENLEKAYMLRASIYQIFHYLAIIVGGVEYGEAVAADIYSFYGEDLEDFKQEITNA